MRRIIVGDPHGCLNELQALVQKVGYRQGHDSLTVVGDVLDRGPKPVQVVEYCMAIGAYNVRGNHDDNALRWLAYEERVRNEPGFVNPMEAPQAGQPKPPPRPFVAREGKVRMTPEQIAAEKAQGIELGRLRREARLAKGGPAEAPPQVRKAPAPPPRPVPEERKAEWRALTPAQIRWLDKPCYLDLSAEWYVVHAGVEPRPFDEQDPARVMRIRYVDPTTNRMVGYDGESMRQPPGTVWWMEVWPGPQNIIYGHAVHSLEHPRVDIRETPNGIVRCFGIDTGCCFGGRLTAMVFEDEEMRSEPHFVQVQAERAYVPLPGGVAVAS